MAVDFLVSCGGKTLQGGPTGECGKFIDVYNKSELHIASLCCFDSDLGLALLFYLTGSTTHTGNITSSKPYEAWTHKRYPAVKRHLLNISSIKWNSIIILFIILNSTVFFHNCRALCKQICIQIVLKFKTKYFLIQVIISSKIKE